ncbi:M16 family metallopeptidase [Fulvivirga sedimenti]|uniref:Insulinase family protein n=1 Tax=Fulvivirga sedimenti TaxID=2879465 RepID=A0A9X1L271_9BACT|nr:pitrilysin family protein [Fulvivirga sedimenti]MCA6078992.1 insulinase family protein [Fulvivirga sedimenti]
MLDRTRPPAYSQTFELHIPRAKSELRNQTNFHAIAAGKQPVSRIEIIFPKGGSYYDSLPGLAYLTNKMLTYGTPSRNHHDIVESFDRYGAFVKLNPSFDDPSLELYCLNKNAGDVIPVLADIIRHSIFPDEDFALVQKISAEQIRIQNSRNSVLASKLFRSTLFGEGHPYGQVMKPEDLDMLDARQLRAFFMEQCREYEIIVTGDADESLTRLLGDQLAFSKPIKDDRLHDIPEPKATSVYQEKENSLQTSLRIGKLLPHKSDPDYIPLRICLHALGGYFGSRLMKNIREEKGYTYGIYASMVPLRFASYLVIGSDVQKANRTDAINEVNREIRLLQDELLREEELQMVRNHMLGSFQSDLSSPFALSEKFKGVYLFGLDYSYYDRYIETIETITPQHIREMAQKYLDPESMTEISVG